tara:strand:+ start:25457 stop:27013 length:1557 start_codon:yes stop_codon:yes gene_type:complete
MFDEKMNALPAPGQVLNDANMRVQEVIHGHRLIPEQEPFMVVLETLCVCAAQPLGSTTVAADNHEAFSYDLPQRRKMRFLLFVDRNLEKVIRDTNIADSIKWSAWKDLLNRQYNPTGAKDRDDFAYLDEPFGKNIYDLFQAIDLLRSRELDVMHNRRWTSRFLAVTGPDMICTDMREAKKNTWSSDRRFFGRGGELVYLMLNRSSHAQGVGALVNERLLNKDDPMNKVAVALSDPEDKHKSSTSIGYLPLKSHPAYDRMAEDWKGILTLARLPDGHLFEPLFRITGLNLMAYLAERAQEVGAMPQVEPIVVDLTDGDDKKLRESSKAQLNRHRQNANRAVKAYIETTAQTDEGWQTAVAHNNPDAASKIIQRLFHFETSLKHAAPADQLEDLIHQALRRDKNNTHRNLLPMLKDIGLATSRPRIGTWIVMDDAMITALVMANVSETVELRDFVSRLYQRYNIVIGPQEARLAFNRLPVSVQSFEANLSALEIRMTRLSLTKRLSDDCAFVTNPYRQVN